MRIEQKTWTPSDDWTPGKPGLLSNHAQLVLAFGSTAIFRDQDRFRELKNTYPKARIVGCTTAGEIYGTHVEDDTLVITAVYFEETTLQFAQIDIQKEKNSRKAGEYLARALPHEGLVHVLVISDGLQINGSELVKGLTENIPRHVGVTGGLAGDGARFEQTLVCTEDVPSEGEITAVGFYGDRLKVGYGSLGGWDPFGPDRLITRSKGNVLFELDGQSALELYKKYLGEHAEGLPATGLLFPLSLKSPDSDERVVRTILAVNETDQSMTFAGDVSEGSYVRLMKANFDRLIDGATSAARSSYENVGATSPDLALLISCVGRKLVLKQRVEEEVESVREVLGDATTLTGFYSYGEISPFTPSAKCELHNQTMTITTLSER